MTGKNSKEAEVPEQAGALIQSSNMPAELRKPPEAIFVKSRGGPVTLAMHKAYNFLIARAAEMPRDQTTYRVSLRELGLNIQFDNTNNIEAFKEMLRRLNVTQVEWGMTRSDSEVWGVSTMLAGVQIRRGELEYSFAPQIKDKLLDPQVFARIDLRLMAKFRTRSGLALYEACYRYINNPSGVTVRMPWEQWRSALCSNIGPKEWRYFNRDIIKPAVREVNTIIPDMEIEPILFYGAAGKVTELQFRVTKKRQRHLNLDTNTDISPNSDILKRLSAIGIQEAVARKLLLDHEEEKIVTALTVTETRVRSKRAKAIENPAAFFTKALADGYLPPADQKKNNEALLKTEDKRRKDEEENASIQIKNEAYNTYQALNEEQQGKILAVFVEEVINGNPTLLAELSRKGLKSAIIKGLFKAWLVKQSSETSDWKGINGSFL